MAKRYQFREEELAEMNSSRQKNKDKNVEKRLKALMLYAQGKKCSDIASQTGYAASYISELMGKYRKGGLGAIVDNHYHGNNRNMSFEEEEALLEPFMEKAAAGQIIEVSEILKAYEEKMGRTFERDHGRIYRVLNRHGWRKIMPRSKQPNKASQEEIDSLKITIP